MFNKIQMIKSLTFLALLLVVSSSFNLKPLRDIVADSDPQNVKMLYSCTSSQTRDFYQALSFCQQTSKNLTSRCLFERLHNTTKEQWDVYVADSNLSYGIAISYYQDCQIVLKNYGKFNRTYQAWIASKSSTDKSQKKDSSPIFLFSNPNSNGCSLRRVDQVITNIDVCQQDEFDDKRIAECMKDGLKQDLNEVWNIIATRTNPQLHSIDYWFYDNCNITYQNGHGINRTMHIWKAQ